MAYQESVKRARPKCGSVKVMVLLVGLLVLAGLMLWSLRLSPDVSVLDSQARLPVVQTPLAPPAAGLDAQGQLGPVEPEAQEGPAAERSLSTSSSGPLGASSGGQLARFRVTAGPGGGPLAGVEVHAGSEHLVGKSELGEVPSAQAFQADPVHVAVEQLPTYQTNSLGVVEVEGWMSGGVVAAVRIPATESSPALEAWINPSSKQVRGAAGQAFPLALRERQTWNVRAVDGSGRGRAGVEIQAQLLHSKDVEEFRKQEDPTSFPTQLESGKAWVLPLGTTGPGGHLAYAGSPLIETSGQGGDPVVAVLLAAVVPGEQVRPVLQRETQRAGSVIDLPMSPSVETTIRLLDHQERPLFGWHSLRVSRVSEESSTSLRDVLVSGGEAAIGALPTRSRLRLQLGSDGGLKVEAVSPPTDGSPMTAELQAGSEHAVLSGRLVDGTGGARAGRRIECRGAGWTADGEGTDQAGRFSVLVPLEKDMGVPQTVVIQVGDEPRDAKGASADSQGEIVSAEHRFYLEGPLEAATYDLGDLMPSALRPLLVAGRVVAPAGTDYGQFDVHVEARTQVGTWHKLHSVEASTSIDGDFSIHGDFEPGVSYRLLVQMQATGFLPLDPIPFPPGSTDLRVDLEPASALTVRVASPLAIGSGRSLLKALDIVLEETSAPAQEGSDALKIETFGLVGDDGLVSLRWSGLRTGNYRLNAFARGTETLLASMPNLAVSGPQTVAPYVLDLNAALYRFHLKVTGPDGTPLGIARASLHWVSDSGRGGMDLRGASNHGIAPNVPIEIHLQAEGYISARQALRGGPQQVAMQPVTLLSTQIRILGLEIPEDVRAELAWGPAALTRDVHQATCFDVNEDLGRALNERRIGRQPLDAGRSVTIEQPARPGPAGGLRIMLVLSAAPLEDQPGLPTKVLLDELAGWVLPNPQASSATLTVDPKAARIALESLGRAR